MASQIHKILERAYLAAGQSEAVIVESGFVEGVDVVGSEED